MQKIKELWDKNKNGLRRYFLKLLIAIDQLLNAILAGYPDETLSARAHRARVKGQKVWGWTADAIDFIFFWQDGHCKMAYESELRKKHLPKNQYDNM